MAFVPINHELSSLDFSDSLVRETGIMTLPAEMFHYDGAFLRIGFGRKNFKEALDKLDAHLRKKT